MLLHTLRSREQSRDALCGIAEIFLRAVFAGDGGPFCADGFTWFGRRVDLRGTKPVDAAVRTPRLVEPAFIAALGAEARARVFGSLEADDAIVLVDLTRGDRTSTVAVVVTSEKRVRAVTDAYDFREAFELA